MSREDNKRIFEENKVIVRNNFYIADGRQVSFEFSPDEHKRVIVISPVKIKEIISDKDKKIEKSESCKFSITNGDSFSVKTDIVLNFASATRAGGGYETGASAQEEALCRQSTLYSSIASRAASEMYNFNRDNPSPLDSDYMLISPCVEVFRDVNMKLLPEPHKTAVITSPAPNLNRRAAGLSKAKLHEVMTDKVRKVLIASAYYGFRTITLGAWGCGVFGHNPADMAGYFREVLIDEKYCELFDGVVFAILDKTKSSPNYTAFEKTFADYLGK